MLAALLTVLVLGHGECLLWGILGGQDRCQTHTAPQTPHVGSLPCVAVSAVAPVPRAFFLLFRFLPCSFPDPPRR
ncbi:hypothetical protein P376_5121 [Streptomyces sp. HCCB10043]|nr:hypothetical protein P376_5121 [Streptomyces sp. HCCB10043]